MARIIDDSKLDRIKQATIELIVEKGYGGASISNIAKKAGVADGYLYRFYNSKEELVNSILHTKISFLIDKMEYLLESSTSTQEIINTLVAHLFAMANEKPVDIKFLYILMHDYTFQIAGEQRELIKILIQKVLINGKANGEIYPSVSEEELYNMAITYPIVFLNLRLKNFFGNSHWDKSDELRVSTFCASALKN